MRGSSPQKWFVEIQKAAPLWIKLWVVHRLENWLLADCHDCLCQRFPAVFPTGMWAGRHPLFPLTPLPRRRPPSTWRPRSSRARCSGACGSGTATRATPSTGPPSPTLWDGPKVPLPLDRARIAQNEGGNGVKEAIRRHGFHNVWFPCVLLQDIQTLTPSVCDKLYCIVNNKTYGIQPPGRPPSGGPPAGTPMEFSVYLPPRAVLHGESVKATQGNRGWGGRVFARQKRLRMGRGRGRGFTSQSNFHCIWM